MGEYVCKICGQKMKNEKSLLIHYAKTHKLTREQVYKINHPDEGIHLCKNCGNPTKLHEYKSVYRDFCCNKCAIEYQHKNISQEDKKKLAEKKSSTWKNKSQEELKKYKQLISNSNRKSWAEKTKEEIKQISNNKQISWENKSKDEKLKFSNILKEYWKNKPEDEKREWVKNHKLSWENKSEEEMKEFSKKLLNSYTNERRIKHSEDMLDYWNNLSQNSKEKIIKKISKSNKMIWGDKSEEELKEFGNKLKLTWQNKSEEELEEHSKKLKIIWGVREKEYISQIYQKVSKSNKEKWKNKSEEKRLSYINSIRLSDITPEQYEILNNKDKFKNYLIEYKSINGDYPTPLILSKEFNFKNESGILLCIHQYNLEDYISWGKSSSEQEVYDYIKSIYDGEIIRNNRSIIPNYKELDIYIPEKNLAIEFDGCYWHSKLWKDNHYHQNKSKTCLDKDIRLIHIYEDEWIYKQDIVKDIIKSALGLFEEKIYARKCEVRVVDKQIYKNMCQYHLQGYSPAQIILGLYYQDQLIQLASFSKSRYDKNYEYEWIRGVQLPGYQIVGGTSKLFKYFIKNYQPKSIICYSDFNKFSGNSYKNCGFTLDKITTPDMWFNEINGLKRINRQPSKHQLTKQLVESGDLLEMHGAGNMKWVWRKNNDR